jgi:hypothetical protein
LIQLRTRSIAWSIAQKPISAKSVADGDGEISVLFVMAGLVPAIHVFIDVT